MTDKTIKPSFSSRDTITPKHGLFDQLNMPINDRLVPSFLVYHKEEMKKYEIGADDLNFSIGSGENCDIVIEDPLVSEVQVNVH